MEAAKIRAFVEGVNPEALAIEGMDEALVGWGSREPAGVPVLVYDAKRYIEILVRVDKMEMEEAKVHFWKDVAGADEGAGTPLFVLLARGQEKEASPIWTPGS